MEISAGYTEKIYLVISDETGRIILHQYVNVEAGSSNVSIQAGALPPGIYLLYGIGKEGRTNTVKLVKQ